MNAFHAYGAAPAFASHGHGHRVVHSQLQHLQGQHAHLSAQHLNAHPNAHPNAHALYRSQLPMRADLPAGYSLPHPGHLLHHGHLLHGHPLHHSHHGHGSDRIIHGSSTHVNMSDPAAYMASDEELAQLQKLSNEYEPEITGPLVGERQNSSHITTEYATADPVYRTKTAALPSKYAYFRTCRGDGHCGWRAIAFTYFEALLRAGDANKFEDETVRLQSMNNLLNSVGFVQDIYEDFADQAFELLQTLAASVRAMDGRADRILLETFNDYAISMAIVTYFKLLASAWIQSHPDDFLPFMLDYPSLKQYCEVNIEAANCEIDHIAMVALAETVVKPACFGLEVLYLDRSPGIEINNTFRVEPSSLDGFALPNAPVMRLLYRPGHYDILYKAEDFPAPVQHAQPIPQQPPLNVALANYASGDFVPMATNMTEAMNMIPGLYATGSRGWPSIPYDYSPSAAPQPQAAPVPTYAPAPAPVVPMASIHQEYVSPIHVSHLNHHIPPSHHDIRLEPPVTLPIHPAPPMTIERGTGPFRPSVWELEPGLEMGRMSVPSLQTSIFRNSHYNTAHFLNPEFQPEEWSPDMEYANSNRGRHKSTSQ